MLSTGDVVVMYALIKNKNTIYLLINTILQLLTIQQKRAKTIQSLYIIIFFFSFFSSFIFSNSRHALGSTPGPLGLPTTHSILVPLMYKQDF